MNRPARLLFPLLLLLLPIMQGVAFEDPTLSLEAGRYHDRMRQARGSEQPEQSLQRARRYASQSLWRDAIDEYEAVIAADAATPTVWYRLAQAWNRYDSGWRGQRRARAAAYTSYRTADAPDLRARALFQLGELLLENEPRLAREAWREGLGLVENERIAERYRKLDEQLAFQVKELDVESDSARPRICLRYSETLAQGRDLHHADYLQLDPAIDPVVSIHDDRLCIEGVSHGTTYTVTVRPGLPAASGERTRDSQRFVAEVENRSPSVGFRGRTYILPRTGDQNLPLTTVNVDRVRIEVLRINDRNLTQQINADNLLRLLDGYDSRRIAEQSGESVWSGALDIRRELNQEVSSALPMREVLPHTEPGIYVVTAHDAADDPSHWQDLATQWLVISDLGLTTLQGEDGLHAFVRSLASAGPLADVELRLYARNNSELGRVVTDERGYGQFPAGLLGGRGGRTPAALMAYGTDGDFNFLDLTTAAFDLGDRGVSGRPAPGPYDAFLYSDRGVYRPGETVQLVALLRDARGRVPAQIPPLTLSLIRPDQAEAERRVLDQHLLGGFHTALNLPGNARTGRWLARLHLDPEADPVGELRFLVEDFVPQRLELSLATEAERLAPGSPVQVEVSGRFLYGAPAAELATEAELVLREAATPFPDHADFHFGPVDAEFSPQRETLDIPPTDARGRSAVTVALAEPPQTQRPLEAVLRVALFEPGGRPVNRRLVLPYRNQPLALGIRPDFADPVSRQQPLAFDLVALDPAGEPQALADLRYTLYRENHDYYWYYRNNRWNYKLVVSDSAPLVSRRTGLDAAPTRLELAGLDSGRYRLEVRDPASGALSSLKFRVGWFVEPGGEARPDELQITLDRSSYGAGDIARVHVRAPFAGEVLLTVADHRLWLARSFTLEEGGTTFELPVDPAWSPGVYLLATAYRPGDAEGPQRRGPGRALGVTWLALDRAPRTLDIALQTPERLQPRQSVEVPVQIGGLDPGQPAYLSLAAVDEGILQLTDHADPDPLDHYFGKRRLAMEPRDLYGRLIESAELGGRLQYGAGAGGNLDARGPQTVRTVALFSGLVELDGDGHARIPLDLPDFNGELRLMAVAWDRYRYGQTSRPLRVSDPLVAEVYLPRFLAPNDHARLTLDLRNLDAPAGDYNARLRAEGAVSLADATPLRLRLTGTDDDSRLAQPYTLIAGQPGEGRIALELSGPEGFRVQRDWVIGVRPAQPHLGERRAQRLAPGETLTLDGALLAGYLPGTASARLRFSARPGLNVPELLARLDRYPYGCLEQTTSRALPLLYYADVARRWLQADTGDGLRQRVQDAVERVLAMQQFSGGFGLWSPDSPTEGWLSAYAMDFLTRARENGYLVAEPPYRRGLEWLQRQLAVLEFEPADLSVRAYMLYALSRAGEPPRGELRYLHDNHLDALPTRLARAQLGAALARSGDPARAREAFRAALALDPVSRDPASGYGSALRDRAGPVALLAEADLLGDELPLLTEQLAAAAERQHYTSTQEQAWLLLAARALSEEPGALELRIDGQRVAADPYYLAPDRDQLARGIQITNAGHAPVWTRIDSSGVPTAAQPPVTAGLQIERRYYDRDGNPVDQASILRNDRLVVVIRGEARTGVAHQALVVDLLPAGLEIENSRLGHNSSTADLDWLPELSDTRHIESLADRYVAALDLPPEERRFTLAYQVRAVTPGDYALPAVFVEDMYQPWFHGRGASARLAVR